MPTPDLLAVCARALRALAAVPGGAARMWRESRFAPVREQYERVLAVFPKLRAECGVPEPGAEEAGTDGGAQGGADADAAAPVGDAAEAGGDEGRPAKRARLS